MKQNPKNTYLIFVTDSVIFMSVFIVVSVANLVNALPQTNSSSIFHFPDVQNSNSNKDRNLQNIHRIIFGAENKNDLNSFSSINIDSAEHLYGSCNGSEQFQCSNG